MYVPRTLLMAVYVFSILTPQLQLSSLLLNRRKRRKRRKGDLNRGNHRGGSADGSERDNAASNLQTCILRASLAQSNQDLPRVVQAIPARRRYARMPSTTPRRRRDEVYQEEGPADAGSSGWQQLLRMFSSVELENNWAVRIESPWLTHRSSTS